jgi:hypothetical protein
VYSINNPLVTLGMDLFSSLAQLTADSLGDLMGYAGVAQTLIDRQGTDTQPIHSATLGHLMLCQGLPHKTSDSLAPVLEAGGQL